MPTLLQLDSSYADPAVSRSRALTAVFADAWTALGPEHRIVHRDLHLTPPPHLPDPALHWPPRLRPPGSHPPAEAEALQQDLLTELFAADVLLIGAPLYNFSMASTLKAWLDYIHVPGVSADFDGSGQPMLGRPAVVITSRGAVYDAGTPTEGWDHAVPPLQIVLGNALGMDVSVIVTSRTLADTVVPLAGELEQSKAEFAAATEAARAMADQLGNA